IRMAVVSSVLNSISHIWSARCSNAPSVVKSHLYDYPDVVSIRCVLGPILKPEYVANIDIFRHRREAPIVKSINLSLTDELRAFVNRNSGDGTPYATPSEFLRDVLREKKERMEAAELRDGIVEGYRDLIKGR